MSKQIVYQMLPRLWGRGHFADIDGKFLAYLRSLGVDYLYLTGIPRHASAKPFVKGDPGCPYSICDYYDTNPYLAQKPERRMEEFSLMLRRIHRAGLKLLIDFVPNHVSCDYADAHGGIPVFGHYDYDWSDTRKINYDHPETLSRMAEVLKFWAAKGVDGFRCDMVELVGPDRCGAMISSARAAFPSLLFVAEVYGREGYHSFTEAGFDLLYDKSGIYDILRGIFFHFCGTSAITRNWQELGGLQERMLNFLENHDEQRLCSSAYAGNPKKTMALAAVTALFNRASLMLYAGGELGENASEAADGRTSIFNWVHPASLRKLHKHLHGAPLDAADAALLERWQSLLELASSPLCREGENWDLNYCNAASPGFDPERHFAFLRFNQERCVLIFCNFSDKPASVRLHVPVRAEGDYSLTADAWDFAVLEI